MRKRGFAEKAEKETDIDSIVQSSYRGQGHSIQQSSLFELLLKNKTYGLQTRQQSYGKDMVVHKAISKTERRILVQKSKKDSMTAHRFFFVFCPLTAVLLPLGA